MWRRLITILSWLGEEDRAFLVSSEGLGNSQKAEVAWLQRKGYAYTEVEVDMSSGWKVTWSLRLFHQPIRTKSIDLEGASWNQDGKPTARKMLKVQDLIQNETIKLP